MRKAALVGAVAGAYAIVLGVLGLIVVALTAALADGWMQRAAAALLVDSEPRFSPDGSQIAFIRRGDGPARLWVMSSDGTDQRPLAQAAAFSWETDAALVFSRGGARVFRVGADGGAAVLARRARLRPGTARSHHRTVFVRSNHIFLRDAAGAVWELT